RLTNNINNEEIQLKTCYDTLNGLHRNLNEIDRNEYTNHIRSVENQIADIKQRLIHFEKLSIEHQNEYKNFEKNLQLFVLNINTFKQTLQIRLMQITIDDMKIIDVELEQLQEQIEKRKEHLSILIHQRQELDQASQRLIVCEKVKQGYSREGQNDVNLHMDELLRKLNSLEESIHDRNRQLNGANEQRREFDRIMSKLSEWIKTIEQQIKDPLTNDLQQTTNSLKEKNKSIQALLESTKDRTNEFDDLTRIYMIVSSTLNDTDRITLDEKYTLLQEKYNRLLDNLTQRLTLLDEANRERDEFDKQNEYVQNLYQQLQNDFTKLKQQSSFIDDNRHYDLLSIEKHLEQFKQFLKRLDETNNNLKELTRLQRLLTSKGHRIDFRTGGELNANLKNLQEQIHNEIERMEKALQTENDFYHLEKELESYLQISSEHLKSAQY
ncbi:unnamed protein product, partial [Rotaria sordida]